MITHNIEPNAETVDRDRYRRAVDVVLRMLTHRLSNDIVSFAKDHEFCECVVFDNLHDALRRSTRLYHAVGGLDDGEPEQFLMEAMSVLFNYYDDPPDHATCGGAVLSWIFNLGWHTGFDSTKDSAKQALESFAWILKNMNTERNEEYKKRIKDVLRLFDDLFLDWDEELIDSKLFM